MPQKCFKRPRHEVTYSALITRSITSMGPIYASKSWRPERQEVRTESKLARSRFGLDFVFALKKKLPTNLSFFWRFSFLSVLLVVSTRIENTRLALCLAIRKISSGAFMAARVTLHSAFRDRPFYLASLRGKKNHNSYKAFVHQGDPPHTS